MSTRRTILTLLIGLLALLAACRGRDGESAVPTAESPLAQPQVATATVPPVTPTPVDTPTPEPSPTPTEPLAATVNGRPIYLRAYEAELARYEQGQAALGVAAEVLPADYPVGVLNALIDRELILQAAESAGVAVPAETVDARLVDLRAAAEANGGFDAWLAANGWTEEAFREALAAELVTGEMAARVTAGVPETTEQVRARYIQFDDPAMADEALTRARAGDDFGFLAQQYSVDRVTGEIGGDLGFFAAGSLLVPEVEAAAFALQPDEISEVISAPRADGTTGYYIVQVTERDLARELTADARYKLLQASFDEWLQGLRDGARIERLVP